MFVASTKKGSTFFNVAILFTIVVVATVVALSLVKLKKDPKDESAQRFALGLGKKK